MKQNYSKWFYGSPNPFFSFPMVPRTAEVSRDSYHNWTNSIYFVYYYYLIKREVNRSPIYESISYTGLLFDTERVLFIITEKVRNETVSVL